MTIIQHNAVTGADLHGILAYTVATTAARDALAVASTDIGKVARVSADNSFYILTSTSPAVWSPTGAPPVTSIANISGGSLGSIPYQSAPSTTALLGAGTSGQVLTSNGAAAPSWQVAPAFTGGTIGAITLPSATLGASNATPVAGVIQGASGTVAGLNSASLYVKGGSQSGTGLDLGFGGSLYLAPGAGHARGYDGDVIIQSAVGAERFRITNTGAWSVGAGGSAYGTTGQVLTSTGNSAPTWTTPIPTVSTDANNTYTKAQRGGVVALTAGATVTADFAASNNFSLSPNQSFTMAFPTNVVAGQSGVIVITQDSTGGKLLTWAAGWVAGDGATPVLSTAANAVDYIYYYTESSSRIMVSVTKNVR